MVFLVFFGSLVSPVVKADHTLHDAISDRDIVLFGFLVFSVVPHLLVFLVFFASLVSSLLRFPS
jgi:hypothetical protein